MKKLLLLMSFALAVVIKVYANDADMFSYDKTAVKAALSELSVLETYVTEHPAIAVVNETKSGSYMINGIELMSSRFMSGGDVPLGIPAFFWGCVFGVVGVAIVYFVTNGDKDQVRKAIYGCIPWVVVWAFYFILWDAVFVTAKAATPGY